MDPSPSSTPSSPAQAKRRSGGSFKYYALCGVGGALATGFTRPLQTLLQYAPSSASSIGAQVAGAHRVGNAPPMACFLREGFYRFALYEGFKRLYGSFFGDDGQQLRIPISIFSAMNVQLFANAAFIDRAKLIAASGQPLSYEHHGKELFEKENVYDLRRMRNTMISFPCYEYLTEKMYKTKPKADCSTTEQLLTTFSAAYIAGFTCALVTHPLDVLPVGISHLFPIRRFLPRSHAMASCSALHWLIYEGFKLATSADQYTTVSPSQKASNRPEMPESLRLKLEEWKQRRLRERPTVASETTVI